MHRIHTLQQTGRGAVPRGRVQTVSGRGHSLSTFEFPWRKISLGRLPRIFPEFAGGTHNFQRLTAKSPRNGIPTNTLTLNSCSSTQALRCQYKCALKFSLARVLLCFIRPILAGGLADPERSHKRPKAHDRKSSPCHLFKPSGFRV